MDNFHKLRSGFKVY